MYRRHLNHSRVKNLFTFVSAKMNTVFIVESSLEFDTCFHLEYSPAVKEFEAQPEGYYYIFEGRECPYTPDFRVVDQHGNASIIEVKPNRHRFSDTTQLDKLTQIEVSQLAQNATPMSSNQSP